MNYKGRNRSLTVDQVRLIFPVLAIITSRQKSGVTMVLAKLLRVSKATISRVATATKEVLLEKGVSVNDLPAAEFFMTAEVIHERYGRLNQGKQVKPVVDEVQALRKELEQLKAEMRSLGTSKAAATIFPINDPERIKRGDASL